jgi:hypothetical protein
MYRRENGTSLTLAGPTENVGGDWAKVMPLHFDTACIRLMMIATGFKTSTGRSAPTHAFFARRHDWNREHRRSVVIAARITPQMLSTALPQDVMDSRLAAGNIADR